MGNPSKKKNDKSNEKGVTLDEKAEGASSDPSTTTLDELKRIMIDKFDSQELKFTESFKSREAKLQIATVQQRVHLADLTNPIIEKQKSTDLEIKILKEDLEAQRKETRENRKIIDKVVENTPRNCQDYNST